MAKYYGIGGLRKGKVGNEKYYLRNNKNFIQEAKKYIPINSNWLTKEEFKNYILSLLQQGIPQVYVLEQLPEEIYPDALIFVQNQQGTSVYVDKEGIRTKINIGGGGEGEDAVDIVNNIPVEPKNNTIYFVNNNANKEKKIDKKELKDTPLECDIYVCDNNILRKIEVDYTEVLNQAKAYTDEKILSASGAEVVTSLPAEMKENKLYYVTRSSSLSQDYYYTYIKQNGQQYYLGEIQHHPGSNKKLWFKQVFITRINQNIYAFMNYYLPNSFEATFTEVWNYLGELGCIDNDHGYPAAGRVGSNLINYMYQTGSESNKQIMVMTKSNSGTTQTIIYDNIATVVTSTVIKIL